MSRITVSAVQVSYRGVAIERPCRYCDATSYHYDGLCDGGPCTVCGVTRRAQGASTHPRCADGTYSYDCEQHDWAPHHYEPAEISERYPAFEAIVEAARELGWPEHYTSDLYRDYQMIGGLPADQHFVWVVRSSGTHIVTPQYVGWRGILDYFEKNEKGARVFYWNTEQLVEIDWEQATTLLDHRAVSA